MKDSNMQKYIQSAILYRDIARREKNDKTQWSQKYSLQKDTQDVKELHSRNYMCGKKKRNVTKTDSKGKPETN